MDGVAGYVYMSWEGNNEYWLLRLYLRKGYTAVLQGPGYLIFMLSSYTKHPMGARRHKL